MAPVLALLALLFATLPVNARTAPDSALDARLTVAIQDHNVAEATRLLALGAHGNARVTINGDDGAERSWTALQLALRRDSGTESDQVPTHDKHGWKLRKRRINYPDYVSFINALIRHGADADGADCAEFTGTPIWHAGDTGRDRCIVTLLHHGAGGAPEAELLLRFTYFDLVVASKNPVWMRPILVLAIADPHISTSAIALLIENGSIIGLPPVRGIDPSEVAAAAKRPDVVRLIARERRLQGIRPQ